ncbi:hypothetical protein FIBSPDRAFT_1052368 [Athelia psychrophila]|uniref:Uncharacterized protein n=1 Tax=Athelia psychrophila TaxID=1759441 RepID=A0A165XHK7_9AGAM|nr:hypothetical protein FIBSPDRAFT_1052368 [Fibularhizoctonia sp. CBS 109695]
MLSIEIIAWALLLGGNYGISMSAAEPLPPDSEGSHCTVQAWVRAEDLIPSSILNGDLRIKVDPSCSEEIVSVALQLRLDEYAEVKFPKKGVVMPTEPVCGNMSSEDDTSMRRPPVWIRDNMEGSEDDTSMWRLPVRIRDNMEDSDTEMGRYYAALRDPDIWEVHAEERTAWKAAVTLHEGSFDGLRCPSLLVTFSDGRLVEVPAGYTAFHPVPRSFPQPAAQAVSANVAFSHDRCCEDFGLMGPCSALWSPSDDAGTYTARIDLENGGFAHAGDVLKGTVNFHTNTSDIRLVHASIESSQNHGWAQSRARDGGSDTFSPGSCFAANPTSNEMSPSSWKYAHLFIGEDFCENGRMDRNARKAGALD